MKHQKLKVLNIKHVRFYNLLKRPIFSQKKLKIGHFLTFEAYFAARWVKKWHFER